MTRIGRQWRQTLTIARRDFTATVFTPIFLLFLFAPLIMASFGSIGALGAANVADGGRGQQVTAAIVVADEATALHGVVERWRRLRPDPAPAPFDLVAPHGDPARQARALLARHHVDTIAVLHGPLASPTIVYAAGHRDAAFQLAAYAREAELRRRSGMPQLAPPLFERIAAPPPPAARRGASAFAAVFGIFFLTLFLSGQMVGTMAEERNNKVIEVLAAAVPLESVFLGKLLGMFGVAVLFVGFWGAVVSQIGAVLPADMGAGLTALSPAVGTPAFVLLFAGYFTTAFLLLGSLFLGVGAQASTMREIQLLSLPITVMQVAMFALASAAASRPGSWVATVAEIFPLSSPFAMAGHAASRAELWPHAAALAWQLLWVVIFIATGARLFRRGVLQSGSALPPWRRLFGRAG